MSDGVTVDTTGGGNGGVGRFLFGNNATNPFDGAASGGLQESYAGSLGANPYIKGGAETPYLPALQRTPGVSGGTETFGILDDQVVNSFSAIFSDVRSMAPGNAAAAVMRMDAGPKLLDINGDGMDDVVDFDQHDMLLFFSVNNDPLTNPQLGIDLNLSDPNYLVDLMVQGFELDPAYGGAGPLSITELDGLFVYATLVPEASAFINASVQGGSLRGASINAGDWQYLVPGVSGDFDLDGDLDGEDIDALVANIAGNMPELGFDMNGDGSIDQADLTEWLTVAGAANLDSGNPYLFGDANLDGTVDTSDFNLWNANKFTSTAAWTAGDFTANGVVDTSDFNVWNNNKFTSSGSPVGSLVPEPHMASWFALGMFLLALPRCRTRSSQDA